MVFPRPTSPAGTVGSVRAVIVTESFPPDVNGVAHSVLRVAGHLAHRGHQPLVIAPQPARRPGPSGTAPSGTAPSGTVSSDTTPSDTTPSGSEPAAFSLPAAPPERAGEEAPTHCSPVDGTLAVR